MGEDLTRIINVTIEGLKNAVGKPVCSARNTLNIDGDKSPID